MAYTLVPKGIEVYAAVQSRGEFLRDGVYFSSQRNRSIRRSAISRCAIAKWRILWFLKEWKCTLQCNLEVSSCAIAYNLIPKETEVYAAVRIQGRSCEIAYNLVPKGREVYAAAKFRGELLCDGV